MPNPTTETETSAIFREDRFHTCTRTTTMKPGDMHVNQILPIVLLGASVFQGTHSDDHCIIVSLKRLLILHLDPSGPLAVDCLLNSHSPVYSMHPTHPTPTDYSERPFDKLSFVKYVKDIGREYKQQAIKLVSFCRSFSQAQAQTRSSYDEFRRYYSQIMPILCPVQQLFRKCVTGH